MRHFVIVFVASLASTCAHAPRRQPAVSVEDELVATAVSWATRVPPPAREYAVDIRTTGQSARILSRAAGYAGLVLDRPGVLKPANANISLPAVRLVVHQPQWVNGDEALVSFTYATGGAQMTACAVRIRPKGPDPQSWLQRGEGEEDCWPKPAAGS